MNLFSAFTKFFKMYYLYAPLDYLSAGTGPALVAGYVFSVHQRV